MQLRIAITALFATFFLAMFAQWTDLNVPLTAVWGSDVKAIDYDADGDMDIFICGSTQSYGYGTAILYRNDGNNVFTPINAGFTGVYRGDSSWADFNGDGRLDMVICGKHNETVPPIAKLYLGAVDGSFTYTPTSLLGMDYSRIDSGDYNNDGKQDIIMIGSVNNVDYIRLYRNDGNLVFTQVFAGLQDMAAGQCVFVDYDNDADLDVSVLGSGNCIIYRNDGTDTFVNIHANLIPLSYGASAWGDFDNDGFPDLITCGDTINGTRTDLYRSHGNGTFSTVPTPIPGVMSGSVMWGDYDSDGWLDLMVTGGFWPYGPRISNIYRNNHDRTFTLQPSIIVPISSSSMAWGDIDNDGKLDIIMAGYTGDSYLAKVYRNLNPNANVRPTPPTVVFDQNSSTIVFTGATDTTTPFNGLSYSLRIGTRSGGEDILSVVETVGGYRRTVNPGRIKYYFEPLPNTNYYASAQAIDHSFSGSAFGPEAVIRLQGIPMIANIGESTVNFGDVQLGSSSMTKTVTIQNTGTSTLRVNGATFLLPNYGFKVETEGFPYQVSPGATLDIQLVFTPELVGNFTGTMNIFSNAINGQQLPVALCGTCFYNAAPRSPQNLVLQRTGNSMNLSWDPVVLDVLGNPISVDRYIVLFSEIPDDACFWYLGNTSSTSFSHSDIAYFAPDMFYRVKAIKVYSKNGLAQLDELITANKRRSWEDIARQLNLDREIK